MTIHIIKPDTHETYCGIFVPIRMVAEIFPNQDLFIPTTCHENKDRTD